MGSQVLAEVASADRIDVVMGFIRRSGICPLLDALRRHCGRSGGVDPQAVPLRVLTTTYTGSTERRALDESAALGADVRVSYDTTTTRLHAVGCAARRRPAGRTGPLSDEASAEEPTIRRGCCTAGRGIRSGHSTAYIGSSNLTHSAQVDGLDVARRQGHHRNLLVSATGTGKTVMAALDYVRLRAELPRARLLFVAQMPALGDFVAGPLVVRSGHAGRAHAPRSSGSGQEILEQSQATFRYAMREAAFGEHWFWASTRGRPPSDAVRADRRRARPA